MTTQTPVPATTGKSWYYSKTIWVNILAAIVLIIAAQTGFIVGQDEQAAIILIINLILRAITNEGLTA